MKTKLSKLGGHGNHTVNIDPAFHYDTDSWWATLTPTYQISEVEVEAEFLTRLIVCFSF